MENKTEPYFSPNIKRVLLATSAASLEKTRRRMWIAARIQDALANKGWKKGDLAEALGKRPSQITQWLSGTHNFTTDTLTDIESVLGISFFDLAEKPKENVTVSIPRKG